MNARDDDAMDAVGPEERHGPAGAGADGHEATEDVLPGVERARRPGETPRGHALRLMREFAAGQVAKERAGRRFSCSVCGGRLEDRCGLFEASRAIRRTDRGSNTVMYLGPRWWLCRPCAAIVRRGAWPELIVRTGWVDDYRSEAASLVLELERVLSVEGQVVTTPRFPEVPHG